MSTELEAIKYFEEQNKIVSMYVKGASLTEIQKMTGLSKQQVDHHLAEFKDYASQDKAIRTRAKGIVLELDTHYGMIISDAYDSIEELKIKDDPKAVLTGLKIVADIEAKRMELLAKAGLLADNTIGDQIAESERKQEVLVGILRSVAKKHPEIAREIGFELAKVTGEIEAIG